MRAAALLALPLLAAAPADLALQDRRALALAQVAADNATRKAARLQVESLAADDAADRARKGQAAVSARIEAAEADVAAAQARVAIVADAQRDQRARLAAHQGTVVRLLAAIETVARRPAALALVERGSIDDAVHLRALLAAATPRMRAETRGIRLEMARGAALARDAQAAVAGVRARQAALADERTRLAALEVAERARAGALLRSAADESERAQGLGEETRDLIDLQHRAGDARALAARLAALPGPVLSPQTVAPRPARAPVYRLPTTGRLVTGFGEIAPSGVRARGLTWRTGDNAVVVAPLAGRIAYAGTFRGYGGIVIVDHGSGWTSLLTGLGRVAVRPGATVAAGDRLGTATGVRPAVTLELRRSGRPVDPAPFVAPRRG